MNQRIAAELAEEQRYLTVLGYTQAPDPALDGEHTVHMVCDQMGRCLDRQQHARDAQTQRTHLLRAAALALLRVQRIDEAQEEPYPVGPTPEQRGKGH